MGNSDMTPTRIGRGAPLRVAVMVMPGGLASSVAALCDVFGIANDLLAQRTDILGNHAARFLVTLVAARPGAIALSSGLAVLAAATGLNGCDVLIVPSIGNCGPDKVNQAVALLEPEKELVVAAARAGIRIASVCTGTFLVASTGALKGQMVGVSWLFKDVFEASYPDVLLQPNQSIVRSASSYLSSGGVASAYDLALELIGELCEDETRRKVASVLVADAQRVARWPVHNVTPLRLESADVAERAKAWITSHAVEPITATTVAEALNVTVRTLARHLKKTFDMTATELIQQERVQLAMNMMKSTQLTFDEITVRCGVGDPATFRKVFKRYAGATPLQYRKRFGNLMI